MIKVKFIASKIPEESLANKFSINNDGVYNDVVFVCPSTPDSDVDYIITGFEYAFNDLNFFVDPSKLWLWSGGEPYYYPMIPIFENRKEFSKVLSHKGDSVMNGEFMQIPSMTWFDDITRACFLNRAVVPKTKNISWISSNKIYYSGHIDRLKLIRKIHKEKFVDIYGVGFEYVEQKVPVLEKYKYAIAMENSWNEKDYITEKIADCFMARTMPIYLGPQDIFKCFPEKSLIRMDLDDKFLIEKIKEISESDLYLERMPYIEEARELALDKWNTFEVLSEKIRSDFKNNPLVSREDVFVKGVKPSNNYIKRIYFKAYQKFLLRGMK